MYLRFVCLFKLHRCSNPLLSLHWSQFLQVRCSWTRVSAIYFCNCICECVSLMLFVFEVNTQVLIQSLCDHLYLHSEHSVLELTQSWLNGYTHTHRRTLSVLSPLYLFIFFYQGVNEDLCHFSEHDGALLLTL